MPDEDRRLLEHTDITVHSATPTTLLGVLFPLSLFMALFNFFGISNINKIMPNSVIDLSNSDVLIDLAGVSFMDGRTIFLPFNILTIWPAMLLETPVVKFAQGIGSFNSISTKIAAKLFLPKCKQLFARGEITHSYLKKFFPTKINYQEASDVAFSHKQGDALSIENVSYCQEIETNLKSINQSGKKIVGICPSSVVLAKSETNNIDYIATLSDMIEELIKDKNITIFLFPNATRESQIEKFRNNDLPVIQKIISSLLKKDISSEQIIYITKDINTDSIKSMLQYCDITVVSRFHAMIASLSLVKPVMVLGWSHKYLEVMKQFDMQKWVIDYQNQDVILYKEILEMLHTKLLLEEKISLHLPNVKKESFKQFEYLFNKVLNEK
jgi:polysaccharide pyruvyl transferase WcaK-like protein